MNNINPTNISNTPKINGGLRLKNIFKHTTNNFPLVSIITVIYNGEKYLEQTIKSVLDQSYKNIEYIIIDGGSTDSTVHILKKYDHTIDYWISEPDKGISDAFNKGIMLSTGDIIGLINADDWYEPDTVYTIIQEFLLEPKTDIVCGYLKFWAGNTEDYIFTSDPELLYQTMSVNHPTMFVRRRLYDAYGLFNLTYKYAMDYDLILRFKMKGAQIKSLNKVLANMRLEGTSDNRYIKTYQESRKIKLQYFSKHKVDLYFYKQVISRTVSKLFIKFGLNYFVKIYRGRYSSLKKFKE